MKIIRKTSYDDFPKEIDQKKKFLNHFQIGKAFYNRYFLGINT